MPDSLLRRIKKTLEAPVPGPQHLLYRSVIPLRTRIWESIRPPARTASKAPPMSRSQRRLVLSVIVIAIPSVVGWGIYEYREGAPDRAYAKLQEGIALAAAGKVDQAIGKFSDAIAAWPVDPKIYLERGNAYAITSRPEQAKDDWSKAIELDPTLAPAYVARGTEYRIEGKNDKAAADLDRAISMRPNGEAYYQEGQIFSSLGNKQKALESYTRAIALLPSAPYVYYSRSAVKKELGDTAGSETDLQAAMKLSHASADVGR